MQLLCSRNCFAYNKSFFKKELLILEFLQGGKVNLGHPLNGQYKNRKNFSNLCHHKDDFSVEDEWHFLSPHMARMEQQDIEITCYEEQSPASLC